MSKKYFSYSDLADECILASKSQILGNQTHSGKYGLKKYEFTVSKQDEEKIGKSEGDYVTINCSKLLAHLTRVQDYVATEVAYALRKFILSNTGKKNPFVLVVGLGNGGMVADSLGVKVAENLLITHGIPEFAREELGDLSAIIPGVGGCTGIATYNIILGVCKEIKPDLILAIDTLTACDFSRLGCSFQMSNTGLTPGAGVGNTTKVLNKNTLGIPVIAMGVPMMISGYGICNQTDKEMAEKVFAPKEIDILTLKCARTLSMAINLAVHGKVYKDYC